MPSSRARRAESDAEALLEAQGFASRPGPKVVADKSVLGAINEALRAPWQMKILYRSARDTTARERPIEPYGLLLGTRRYLIAKLTEQSEKAGGEIRRFRLDRIDETKVLAVSFSRPPEFDIEKLAAQSFGSFHDDEEYGEVVWRFTPEAAGIARHFVFHPSQKIREESDGSLTVCFFASGYLEMAWHLYQWGDQVEVIYPPELAALVAPFQCGDFPALP